MKLNRSHTIVLGALLAAQSFTAVAQTTNALAPAGYAKFIADRNIFNPNRVPGRIWTPPPPRQPIVTPPAPRQPDSFSLVGIIGYGAGRMAGVHAFFSGSSVKYQKTAELNDTIATFKVAGIAADSVTLVSGTNTMVLGIGEQLHDDDSGHCYFANGATVRYNDAGGNRYANGNGNNSGRGGFGGGRRRNNNFGNGGNGGNGNFNNANNGYGNFNNGNGGNFNRGRNNFAQTPATSDDSQTQDQTAPGGLALPIMTPAGILTPDGTLIPYSTMAPDNSSAQDNSSAPDNTDTPDNTTPQDNNQ